LSLGGAAVTSAEGNVMPRNLILAVLALVGTTGCWYEACLHGAEEFDGGYCVERLSGIFGADELEPWCAGDLQPLSSCDGLGYSVECGGFWYRPTAAAAQTCR
jgi:hypothetical protein